MSRHLKSLSVDNKDVSLGSSHYCQSQSYKQSDLHREREKKRKNGQISSSKTELKLKDGST